MWASVDDLSDPYNPRAEEAVAASSQVLWSLSGRKYVGLRSVVEYYDLRDGFTTRNGVVYANTAFPYNTDLTTCANCGYPHRLRLRHQPVRKIFSVEINGVPVDPAETALLDRAWLGLPLQSQTCSAVCIRVSYQYGANPPAGGRAAAVALAEQLLLAWDNDDTCRLPARVTNISRQGVSWTILDPQDFLNDGRTGIYTIDLFLKSVNPDNARRPARVFSPDLPRAQTIEQYGMLPSIAAQDTDLGVIAPGSPGWYVIAETSWPSPTHTPYAVVDGVTYDADYFTTNIDGSRTFMLPGTVTYGLADGDSFVIKAHPTVGADVVVVSGSVRFVQGG